MLIFIELGPKRPLKISVNLFFVAALLYMNYFGYGIEQERCSTFLMLSLLCHHASALLKTL